MLNFGETWKFETGSTPLPLWWWLPNASQRIVMWRCNVRLHCLQHSPALLGAESAPAILPEKVASINWQHPRTWAVRGCTEAVPTWCTFECLSEPTKLVRELQKITIICGPHCRGCLCIWFLRLCQIFCAPNLPSKDACSRKEIAQYDEFRDSYAMTFLRFKVFLWPDELEEVKAACQSFQVASSEEVLRSSRILRFSVNN